MSENSIMNRRDLMALGGVAAIGLALDAGGKPAMADVPKPVGGQAPGFYRMKLGAFEVTVVSDGVFTAKPAGSVFPGTPEAEVQAGLKAAHLPTDAFVGQFNTMVVNTGSNLVLLDTGCGPKFGPTGGRLAAQLQAAGIAAGDIDTIVITHEHPDHVWGAVDDSWAAARFPNAAIYVNETEHGFWTDPGLASRMPADLKGMVDGTQAVLGSLGQRVQLVQPGKEIVPGITGFATPGHTPGHMSLRLASGSDQLVFSGDVFHSAALQMAHPEWQFGFDADPAEGIATRKKTLDMLASEGVMVVAYHFPWPGVGYIERAGSAYRWVPAEWSWM